MDSRSDRYSLDLRESKFGRNLYVVASAAARPNSGQRFMQSSYEGGDSFGSRGLCHLPMNGPVSVLQLLVGVEVEAFEDCEVMKYSAK